MKINSRFDDIQYYYIPKYLKRKSLQSDWVQSHNLSHNIVNFPGNSVIFKRNMVMFIVYGFLIWNENKKLFRFET